MQVLFHGGHMHLYPSVVSKQTDPEGHGLLIQSSFPTKLAKSRPLQKLEEQKQ